jgi:hypothetical protein
LLRAGGRYAALHVEPSRGHRPPAPADVMAEPTAGVAGCGRAVSAPAADPNAALDRDGPARGHRSLAVARRAARGGPADRTTPVTARYLWSPGFSFGAWRSARAARCAVSMI